MMESTSSIQESQQAYGPHRPTVAALIERLKQLPQHHEVHAIAINGQTGKLFCELRYEDLELRLVEFDLP